MLGTLLKKPAVLRRRDRMTLPFLVCAAVTAISAIVSLGFSIAAVLKADGEAKTIALYACARSLALVRQCGSLVYRVSRVASGCGLRHDDRSGL